MKCSVCKTEMGASAIRLGVCWYCAEVESIIDSGLDMDDRGPKGDGVPAKTAMEKLQFLVAKGLIKRK